jgi:hypothetical protein
MFNKKEYDKIYCKINKERRKKYYELNKEKILKRAREYKKLHRKTLNLYQQIRRKTNINSRLAHCLRKRIGDVLKGINKSIHTMKLLGCSIDFLKQHLEKQFTKGMTWNNYGRKGWVIDHIRPCASFNMSKLSEQKKCFHYINLQPLWAIDNLSKGAK